MNHPTDSEGCIPFIPGNRELSDSEGKEGRKQLLRHFIPVLVHDSSSSEGTARVIVVCPRPTLSRQEDNIPACLPTVNFNMQPPAKPA